MSSIRLGLLSTLLLGACSSTPTVPAPIVDRNQQVSTPTPATTPVQPETAQASEPEPYIVKKGDNLYRIALENGVAYKDLAAWNGIVDTNGIKVGQSLRLSPPGTQIAAGSNVEIRPLQDGAAPIAATTAKSATPSTAEVKKYPKAVKEPYSEQATATVVTQAEGEKVVSKQQTTTSQSKPDPAKPIAPVASAAKVENTDKSSTKVASSTADINATSSLWTAPTAGKTTSSFTVESKGIDIAGKMGQSIVASGSGKVVYAGSGLRGYGKMIIVQHGDGFLSAYAHNSKLTVKEGDVVKKGEKIAEMGNTDTDQVKLHFELRKLGKPVDPNNYIKLN